MTEISIDTADYETAAGLLRSARVLVGESSRPVAGAHDAHAARLDKALDTFADHAGVAAESLLLRVELLAVATRLAAARLTGLEIALARALAP